MHDGIRQIRLAQKRSDVNKKSAFTLAEVLITLGIIGVVAAITIPALLNNTQETELKTAWKKEYSVISQAVMSIISDNGGSLKGVCTDSGSCILTLLSTKLSVLKLCPSGTAKGNCWHNDNVVKALGGITDWLTTYNIAQTGMILKDGAIITTWWADGANCNHDAAYKTNCGALIIDVNGFKPPNVQGKDVFWIYIAENYVFPNGTTGDYNYVQSGSAHGYGCKADTFSTLQGFGCSAQYLYQ